MADALVSTVVDRLTSFAQQQISLVVGAKTEIQSLISKLQTVRAVLADAEKRQVKEESVKLWLERLKDMVYQMDNVVDKWSTNILQSQIGGVENASMPKKRKVSSSVASAIKQVPYHHGISSEIQSIKQGLDEIGNEISWFNFSSSDRSDQSYRFITTSAIDISEVYGRDADKETILNKLLGHESCELLVVSIVGMGGIGKTTLAQLAYNSQQVKARFDERIWVCVSHPFEPKRVYRAIAESLQNMPCNFDALQGLQQTIQKCISGKKFLVVLDDVWTEDHQLLGQLKNCLNCGAGGSCILVTTRNDRVAEMMETRYIHSLGPLSQEQSLSLFNRIAFSGRNADRIEELGEIGGEIASKCGGLPLALKTIGSMLRTKDNKEEWESVLNSGVWQMDVIGEHLSPPLLLSYYDLPPLIKRCFSLCATFPKDEDIAKENLIRFWMAHSCLNSETGEDMEVTGQKYFSFLVSRSFFQDFKKDEDGNIIRCKMHDIIHDLAQFLTKNECLMMHVKDDANVRIEPPSVKGYHATLLGKSYSSTPDMENLHTLLIRAEVSRAVPSDNMSQYLACLRALELSRNNSIEEVPRELGKLMHLRYLNFSRCRSLKKLPEEICDLCNLQTLDVSHCSTLENLPEEMRKLINLRHLANEETYFGLPKGIGELISLRTLTKFIDKDDKNACSIAELGNLTDLRGKLEILMMRWSVDVMEAEAEAKKAELKNKRHLHHLLLSDCMSTQLVEALQPHPNLKSLKIHGSGGYPSWMMNSCLTQLKRLQLTDYTLFEPMPPLPPLGELPELEILAIEMWGLERIGDEFMGSSTAIAFPKLKKLSFRDMEGWRKWQVKEEEEEKKKAMPCLHSLTLINCPKLEALPDCLLQRTTIQELNIQDSPLLGQR